MNRGIGETSVMGRQFGGGRIAGDLRDQDLVIGELTERPPVVAH